MDAIVSTAKIDGIDIQFKDLFFLILLFQRKGSKDFSKFALDLLLLGEQFVFCDLLGNGASSLCKRESGNVLPHRPSDRNRVDAGVGEKAFVLSRDDRININLRQFAVMGKMFFAADGAADFRDGCIFYGFLIHLPAFHTIVNRYDHSGQ